MKYVVKEIDGILHLHEKGDVVPNQVLTDLGYVVVDLQLDVEGNLFKKYLPDGTEAVAQITSEQLEADTQNWKADRQLAVDAILVTYEASIYQGDEKSQDRMSRAINGLPDDVTTVSWVTEDNSVVELTKADLRAILFLAGQAQTAIWNTGRP